MIKGKKTVGFLLAAMMTFSGSINIFANTQTISQEKLIGSDRYETAVEVSKQGWTQSKTAIIVNGNDMQSALCATPFAKLKNSPILLVNNNSIEESTKNELKRLGVENVYIVDSGNSISKKVEDEIKSLNINISKIAGNSIYEMSTNVAKEMNKIKSFDKVAVVNGEKGLADAVSIASPSAMNNMPIIFVSNDNSNQESLNFLKSKNINKTYIVGGDLTVSENIVKNYPNKERISGNDRNATNAKALQKFYSNKDIENIFVAKDGMGNESMLIDTLSIGVLAAKENSPVLISNGNLDQGQKDFVKSKNVQEVTQVGGGKNQKAFEEILVSKGGSIRNSTKKINLIQAKEILRKVVPGGKVLVCYYDRDDNEYDGKIIKDNYVYEIEIDAFNGSILDIDKEYIDMNNSNTSNITLEKAKQTMLNAVPGSQLMYCQYDKEDNEYEGKVKKDNKIYEIEVSGFDGRVIDIEFDNDFGNDNAVGSATISVEKAKQIMLNKVPGALFVSFKYDKEDNEYEGELRKGNTEYDITVSAVDGRITDYDVDYDN